MTQQDIERIEKRAGEVMKKNEVYTKISKLIGHNSTTKNLLDSFKHLCTLGAHYEHQHMQAEIDRLKRLIEELIENGVELGETFLSFKQKHGL